MRFLHAEQSWLRPVSPDVDCHMVGLAARLLSSIPRQGLTDELSVIYTEKPPLILLVSVGSPQIVTPGITVGKQSFIENLCSLTNSLTLTLTLT